MTEFKRLLFLVVTVECFACHRQVLRRSACLMGVDYAQSEYLRSLSGWFCSGCMDEITKADTPMPDLFDEDDYADAQRI